MSTSPWSSALIRSPGRSPTPATRKYPDAVSAASSWRESDERSWSTTKVAALRTSVVAA